MSNPEKDEKLESDISEKKEDKKKTKSKKKKQSDSMRKKQKKRKKKKTNVYVSSRKTKASVTFYYIIATAVIALAFGSLWAVLDAIQPTGKWEWFLELNAGLQFIVIGALGIIFFGLLIGAWVMFRKGNRFVFNLLYPAIKKEDVPKHNAPAKYITAGLLISVFLITLSLITALLEAIFSGGVSGDFLVFFINLPGGLRVMLVSLFILVITLLIIVFVWIWENGYNMVLNKIIQYNKPEEDFVFSKKQNIAANIVYVINIICVIAFSFGTIWAIADAIAPTGKWDAFIEYSITWKFAIVAALASLLFMLLILSLLFYKRGLDGIKESVFKKQKYEDYLFPNDSARFFTGGLLIFVLVIIIGVATSLISYLVSLSAGTGDVSFIDYLNSLPNGLLILVITAIVFGILWGIIGGNNATRKTYRYVLKQIIHLQRSQGEHVEEEEDYAYFQDKLKDFIEISEDKLIEAKQEKQEEEIKKFSTLMEDIDQKIKFNAYFMRYKEFEHGFESLIQSIEQNKTKKAIKKLEDILDGINGFLPKFEENLDPNTKMGRLFEQTKVLGDTLDSIRVKIEKNLELAGSENISESIKVGELNEKIILSKQLTDSNHQEVSEFIAKLDLEFEKWQENEETETGKQE